MTKRIKVAEQAALLLEALNQGFVTPNAIISWADQTIVAMRLPPPWLIELSVLPKVHKEDVLALLRAHAVALPVSRKVELVALAWERGWLSLRDALPRLFQITILEREGAPEDRTEEPLNEALVEWDCQEELNVLEPELKAKFEKALRQYLLSGTEIAWLFPAAGKI